MRASKRGTYGRSSFRDDRLPAASFAVRSGDVTTDANGFTRDFWAFRLLIDHACLSRTSPNNFGSAVLSYPAPSVGAARYETRRSHCDLAFCRHHVSARHQCPLSGATRKTYARIELFRF